MRFNPLKMYEYFNFDTTCLNVVTLMYLYILGFE